MHSFAQACVAHSASYQMYYKANQYFALPAGSFASLPTSTPAAIAQLANCQIMRTSSLCWLCVFNYHVNAAGSACINMKSSTTIYCSTGSSATGCYRCSGGPYLSGDTCCSAG